MGFSVPAAIGAKVGRPDRTVWAVDGDGCFQMTAQELVTASSERIPIKVAILNNAYLGMVRQWQEMFYDERYSEVYLSPDLPDYVKWAEAMGCVGVSGRVARRGAADHRQGQRDRRPAGGHRLPYRRTGEGVPDGPRRRVQRRRCRAPDAAAEWSKGWCSDGQPSHLSASWSKTSSACWPGSRGCSPVAASTSSPWRWRRPTTSVSAASPSWWTSRRPRSSRSPSSCSS